MADTTNDGAGGTLATDAPNQYADMSADEYSNALTTSGSTSTGGGDPKPKPAAPQPVQTFWDRLLHGVKGQSRTAAMLQGAGRGVAEAALEGVKTIGEGAAYVDRKTGLGEALQPGFNADYDKEGGRALVDQATDGAQPVIDHYLGKRSDDPLAAFTESASQFMAGWAATGELRGLAALKGGAAVAAGLARGAVVDASMFDPYQAQLAELVAKAPVPIAKQLGELLSVKGDDGAIVARLKRAAAGLIPAATIEGLVAASRVVRAGKAVAAGAAPEGLAESAETVQNVAAGEHVPEDAQLHPDPQTLTVVGADGAPIEHAPSPVFADHVEAAQQAESMNAALNARATAGQVDEGQVQAVSEKLGAALEQKTPEALSDLAQSPVDISYHTTPDDAAAIAQKLSDSFATQVRHAVEKQGEVPVEQSMQMALNGLGEVPQNAVHAVMTAGLSRLEGQSAWKLATDYVMKSYQDNISRLTEAVTARPHDIVATEELRAGIQNYFDLQDKFLAANSDAARALRLGQERPKLSGADVKFSGDATASGLPTPNPKATAAVTETKQVGETIRGAMKDAEDAIKNATDTNAVSAADFSLARARKAVEAARKKIADGDLVFEHDPEMAIERAKGIKETADAQRADPQTLSAQEQADAAATKTTTKNPIEELSKLLDAQERRLDTELEKAKQSPRPRAAKQTTPIDDAFANAKQQAHEEPHPLQKPKPEDLGVEKTPDSPVELQSKLDDVLNALDKAKTVNGKDVTKSAGKDLAKAGPVYGPLNTNGLSVQEVQALGRIFKMSGGEPRNAEAIAKAATVIQDGKPIRQALELFTNFLLSGPTTAQTIAASGASLTAFEPTVRIVAGAATGNRALMQEGVDLLAGAARYFKENVTTAALALRDGKSVIDPAPQTIAIGGMTGKVVRTPGAVAGAAHEFSKVTNYRAWVYAKSLREGRAVGLEGDALASYAENNLKAAFGKDGIAVVPDALKYGQLTSMATPFTEGGLGQALSKLNQNALVARFIQPFVKVSTNIFKYTWMSSPGLNMLNKEWRATMMAGGEDAAILHTRSVMASLIGGYAYMRAVGGDLTGRGPSDPELRSLWLKDHQPYSFRVNADSPWHSYSRFEPLSMTLGLMADWHTIHMELGEAHSDTEQAFYAGIAAITSNLASKRYMQGISEFGQVWGSNNPQKVGQYLQNLAANIAVPRLATALNPDSTYREAKTLHDAIFARLPGYSETLDPRFSWAGEPILKTPGVWNRNFVSTTKASGETPAEQAMLDLGQSLVPFPQKLTGTNIDLTDRTMFDNGTGVSPYHRFMDLLNKPKDGGQNLRDAVTDLVTSPEWKDMSGGAPGFPGGEKLLRVQRIKTQHEAKALRELRDEYPKLDNAIRANAAMKNAAITDGEEGVKQVEDMFGISRALKK